MRANAIASLLSHDSELRTREELRMLCEINNAEYLMLYDKNGKEIFASNAYTGFRISSDKDQDSNVYYSLIQGYPYVVTDPVKDDLSGKKLLTAASLITDADGLPDGFILVAADAKKMADVMNKDSIESVVNDFATQENQLIALVDNETGLFNAHTDKNMIGTNASYVLSESVLGRQFKGVVSYDRREAYMVGSLMEGSDLIIVSFNEVKDLFVALIFEVLIAVILILGLFFYPMISSISCAAPALGKKRLSVHRYLENALCFRIRPLYIFAFGYLIFFDILFLYSVAAGLSGEWPEMGFVIEGNWSKGLHLFSLGDVVAIDRWQGTVTDMGIRTTEITNESQDVMIIPNSRIHEVINKSRMKTICDLEVEIPRSIDIEDVQKEVDSFIDTVNQAIPDIHKSLRMGGITEASGSGYKVRLNYNCDEKNRDRVEAQMMDLINSEDQKSIKESK